jgi:hypothetical protein
MAGAFILVAGVIAALRIPALPRLYDWSGGLIAAVILLGPVVLALIGARGRLMGRLARAVRFLRRNGGHSPAVPSALEPEGVDPRDEALRAVLAGSKKRLGAALATHVGSRLLLAAEIYAGLRVLGVHATPGETLVFVAVPIALSVVGTFVPGQIGLQETVQAFVAAALGMEPTTGLTLVLLCRARQLVFVPLSAVLLHIVPRQRTDPHREGATDP